TVPRCVGATSKIINFRVYCPKVLAGIGTLPDTVADRSVPIRLARRTRNEVVADFRRRTAKLSADDLRERLEKWAAEHVDELGDALPTMPEELSDRMQEGCEPLAAIADAAGCGDEARKAFVVL